MKLWLLALCLMLALAVVQGVGSNDLGSHSATNNSLREEDECIIIIYIYIYIYVYKLKNYYYLELLHYPYFAGCRTHGRCSHVRRCCPGYACIRHGWNGHRCHRLPTQ